MLVQLWVLTCSAGPVSDRPCARDSPGGRAAAPRSAAHFATVTSFESSPAAWLWPFLSRTVRGCHQWCLGCSRPPPHNGDLPIVAAPEPRLDAASCQPQLRAECLRPAGRNALHVVTAAVWPRRPQSQPQPVCNRTRLSPTPGRGTIQKQN